jgi:LuxR family maltose regulon positive regulatory protein
VLQSVALHANEEKDPAVESLGEALALAEPGGFARIFLDEGEAMRLLILDYRSWIEKQSHVRDGNLIDYINHLLAAFDREAALPQSITPGPTEGPIARSGDSYSETIMVEPLSQRELEVLDLIAQGLSNQEISERLFLALSTVKGHIWKIYSKLQVQRRTEAIVRARELGLL